MSLNIKNKDAHKLARQLARLTGENMTQAVTEAVRERLQRVQSKHAAKLSDRLLAIGRDCATASEGTVSLGRSWRPTL